MLSVTVNISGDKETLRKLRKSGTALTNMSMAMRNIGQRLSSFYANEVFTSQGGAISERWQPLNKKYKIYKATGHTTLTRSRQRKSAMKTYPGAGPLVKTGKMKKSFVYSATHNSALIENKTPYFKYQQAGTRHIPRRPMMGVNNKVKNIVQEIVNDYVQNEIKKAGL